MSNSADKDQLVSADQHSLQRQDISGFSKTMVKEKKNNKLKQGVKFPCLTTYIAIINKN